jgi:hypothetical protein
MYNVRSSFRVIREVGEWLRAMIVFVKAFDVRQHVRQHLLYRFR